MGGGLSAPAPSNRELRRKYAVLIAETASADAEFAKELHSALHAEQPSSPLPNNKPLVNEALGEAETLSYRLQAHADGSPMSLWHDVPLRSGEHLNFVCEIPKWTRRKFEIATDEAGTPIKQDEKKGKLREFKTGAAGLFFNYGCFPQTWEDPSHVHPDAGCGGDNDPLDVCEIGARQIATGGVRRVKPLGVLCMLDEGEADWKVVAIDVSDPWAAILNDVGDVEEHLPGLLDAMREWFRDYKVADGKPQNEFGMGGAWKDKAYAMAVVEECHKSWDALVKGESVREETKVKGLWTQRRASLATVLPTLHHAPAEEAEEEAKA